MHAQFPNINKYIHILNADLVWLTELAGATPLFGKSICLLRALQCVTVRMFLHCLFGFGEAPKLCDSSITYPQV